MHWLRLSLVCVFGMALAACGGEAPEPQPAETEAIADGVPVIGPEQHILAFGDSLFAGYGLEDGESYPARLESSLRARGINARLINAAVSGDTSAAGLQRLAFTLDNQQETPDLVIVELGGNDLLRSIPPEETKENLSAILEELQRREIPAMLMGMRAPPNLGSEFQRSFDAIYPALAQEYDTALVPFFLEAVYDKPDLMQDDKIHPTARGIEELVAATADDVAQALPEGDGQAEEY